MESLVTTLFSLFLISSTLSAATGYIQIKAPPGIMIFLDGNLKGKTTSEQGGLILQDVPAGSHEIKACWLYRAFGFSARRTEYRSAVRAAILCLGLKEFVSSCQDNSQQKGSIA